MGARTHRGPCWGHSGDAGTCRAVRRPCHSVPRCQGAPPPPSGPGHPSLHAGATASAAGKRGHRQSLHGQGTQGERWAPLALSSPRTDRGWGPENTGRRQRPQWHGATQCPAPRVESSGQMGRTATGPGWWRGHGTLEAPLRPQAPPAPRPCHPMDGPGRPCAGGAGPHVLVLQGVARQQKGKLGAGQGGAGMQAGRGERCKDNCGQRCEEFRCRGAGRGGPTCRAGRVALAD